MFEVRDVPELFQGIFVNIVSLNEGRSLVRLESVVTNQDSVQLDRASLELKGDRFSFPLGAGVPGQDDLFCRYFSHGALLLPKLVYRSRPATSNAFKVYPLYGKRAGSRRIREYTGYRRYRAVVVGETVVAKTIREQCVEGLLKTGWRELTKGRKTWVYVKNDDMARQIFLGQSGSVRIGPTKTSSRPVSTSFKNSLLGILAVKSEPVS